MHIALWVLQALLALVFLGAGLNKLARPKPAVVPPAMGWINDFDANSIRLIGLAEVLGGLGLLLPAALGILPWLTPIAALALAVLMLGAANVHVKRREAAAPTLVLAILALLVFIGRFWIAPFSS
ncbi:DoxX family protein [Deinococcus hopiensis]|uniref:DoxX-like family protein n=1 Tax=Deinococcus hopiensis KR-140 TaxID=695939 RepID=A0A1W1UA38_9DEIO|nr:DoxX family protein [Deinococcus hopiensis]SMB77900.1 DoxX-like family protein [Deinococcus hopiensis KR-140]